jgi:diguanylate cyclase (GGDEF)-like protein
MEKEKILIVNGDKYVRNTLAECLSKDYNVFTSESFMNALKVYKDEKFYTVVTEIDTPETKGIEVISKLQQLHSDVPIIVVTTHKSVNIAVEAMKAGAYDYITKPFNTDELKLVVLHALERKKLQEEAKEKKIYQEMALTDSLTGIYNRRYFDELLRREESRAKRYPQKFSLLMTDIDDFKKYNDTYGHPSGDTVLQGLAKLFLWKIRTTDFAARYGGEEFAIIAPHTDKKNASVLAARLVDMVSREIFSLGDSATTNITISVGLATFNQDADTKEELIQKADQALYQAKHLGKNRVCLFGEP